MPRKTMSERVQTARDNMTSSLPADFLVMIDRCLKKRHVNAEYTERLGLPQTDLSKHSKRSPMFEGKGAARCTALYKLINEAANKIADDYATTEDLDCAVYLQDVLSVDKVVELLLKKHGPHIWSRFDHVTRLCSTEYPRHLCYFEDADRREIELYTYCWVVNRARPKVVAKENGRNQCDGLESPAHDSPDDDDVEEPEFEHVDSVMGEDATAPELSQLLQPLIVNMGPNQSQVHASPIFHPAVPTAQMLPRSYITTATTAGPSTTRVNDGQADGNRSTFSTASTNEDEAAGGDKEGFSKLESRPAIKRRGTIGQPMPLTKRQMKAPAKDPDPDFKPAASRARRQTRDEVGSSDAYPSPPLVPHDTSTDEVDTPNFPNIPDRRRENDCTEFIMSGALPEGTVIAPGKDVESNAGRSIDDTIIVDLRQNPTLAGTEDENADHAPDSDPEDDMPLRPRTSKRSPTTAPSEGDEFFRRRDLASDLLEILLEQLQQANTRLCAGLISLLKSRFKAEDLRLREVYGNDFAGHKDSFDCWIACLGLVIQFYNSTGFKGSLNTRTTFLQTVPTERKMFWIKPFFKGRKSFDELRKKRSIGSADIAKEVGSTLFHLAAWNNMANIQDVEHMTLGFTREMLAWFE